MKKILLLFALLSVGFVSAQQIATNITCNDCQGNYHDLYTELDTGCVVVIDWVMPCATCVPPSLTAYNIVHSYDISYPGRVKFYVVDDYNNTTCAALTNWTVSNSMPGTTTFADSSIRMGDYGTAGMPKIIVLGGVAHYVYYNQNGAGNATLLQNAINTALGETSVSDNQAANNALSAWADPLTEVLSLNFSAEQNGTAVVEIYSADGKLVKYSMQNSVTAGPGTIEIGVADLPAGMYSVLVMVGDRVLRTRIIIE